MLGEVRAVRVGTLEVGGVLGSLRRGVRSNGVAVERTTVRLRGTK